VSALRHTPGVLARIWSASATPPRAAREWSLPTGRMHVVLRLGDEGVRIFESAQHAGRQLPPSVIGGARVCAWLRAPAAVDTVGVELALGACRSVLGVPASALRGTHTALDEVVPWGRSLRQRLTETPPAARARVAEQVLRAHTTDSRDALVDAVVASLAAGASVRESVRRTGRSHRTVLTRFREALGLSPSELVALWRFQRAVQLVARAPARSLADLALEAGFADQAHLARSFKAHAQLTVTDFRAHHVPSAPNHVLAGSTSFKTTCG
jgi:AraC-like DNA-binding protein